MKLEKSGNSGVGANAAIAAEPPATTAKVATALIPAGPVAIITAVVIAAEIKS